MRGVVFFQVFLENERSVLSCSKVSKLVVDFVLRSVIALGLYFWDFVYDFELSVKPIQAHIHHQK